ncbi:nuclear transport factor 2 family protein [Chitinophaga flava]|uniref:SnoaL-like domain-containing protein n=1 Tax=Chitinophaga flava TaxID=2259036 RepID=A0A365XYT7_9BACT|nr:nuclear transport factor 2 family protein [Chitinophaga flava]RBL91503.1 hypothetical protein DF182_02510 [Chitinophaga flava]
MVRFCLFIVIISLLTIACKQVVNPNQNPLQQSADSSYRDVRYRDQQHIEKVILAFCEHFDNGELVRCMEYMTDSIHGEIDGIKILGKQNWGDKITKLYSSAESKHFQTRHILSNIQYFTGANDTVKVSMYASVLWTDLESGQIQLMSVGYYKGKMVKRENKWLIAELNSLPDSRLVKYYYHDQP